VVLVVVSVWVDWPQKPENYLPAFINWPRNEGIHLKLGDWTFDRQGARLGLDLLGGTNIVLQADLSKVPERDRADRMKGLIKVIDRRINAYGVAEPVIQQQGSNRVSVQLPGVKNVQEAVNLIGQTAQLEFFERTVDANGNVVDKPTGLTGADLKRAWVGQQQTTLQPIVEFEFNDRGAQIFGDLTTRLAGSSTQIAVLLDKETITAPVVKSPITGGRGYIEGNFTLESARNLVIQLNAGALPVPVSIQKQQDVDATLGADSIRKSIVAGEIGLGIVMLFMLVHYRLPGLLADAALLIYALVTMAVFKLIPVTLTLAGIAAFILSIGMAVDANILIFERMREELRAGRTLNAAIEAGFSRAWTSIRDSNISTIITCLILYWFGSNFGASLVMGFALTLLVGVVISLFTAITVTRTFLRLVLRTGLARNAWLFGMESLQEPPSARARTELSRPV
jgi:preprotein translocase subunit SecD